MFYTSDHKKDYSDKLILIANYLLEMSGKNEDCKMNAGNLMWFSNVVVKCSDSINVSCKASMMTPWEKETCLITEINGDPLWVHFDFNMMNFSLKSLEEMEFVHTNAMKYFYEKW